MIRCTAPDVHQQFGDFLEIEGVRTDQCRHAQRRGLEQVVAADFLQAAADESDVSGCIERHQLAQRVDHEHFGRLRPASPSLRRCATRNPARRRPPPPRRTAPDGAAPITAMHSEWLRERRDALRSPLLPPRDACWRRSTPADLPRSSAMPAACSTMPSGSGKSYLRLPLTFTLASARAKLAVAGGVRLRLRGHAIHRGHGSTDQRRNRPIALQRPLRQARIGDDRGNLTPLQFREQVRPDLGFHHHRQARLEMVEEIAHRRPAGRTEDRRGEPCRPRARAPAPSRSAWSWSPATR